MEIKINGNIDDPKLDIKVNGIPDDSLPLVAGRLIINAVKPLALAIRI